MAGPRLRHFLGPVLVVAVTLGAVGCSSETPSGPVNLPSGFDLQAHMGGRDARPQNTLPAFAYALSVGVTTLEMDVVITADDVPVINHNRRVSWFLAKNPWGRFLSTDEEPDIRYTTLEDLRKFDVGAMSPDAPYGYWEAHGKTQKPVPGVTIPTLEEVFQLVKDWGNDDVFLSLETKSTPYVVNPANPTPEEWTHAIYDLAVEYDLQDRIMIQSFDWRTLQEMKRIDPRVATVALTANQPSWNLEGDEGDYQWPDADRPSPWMAGLDLKDFGNSPVQAAAAIDADVYSPYYKEVTPEVIQEAHSLGMRVTPYTVNDAEQMRALIAMGVDGIITDRPATLRAVMEELGMPLPPMDPAPEGKPYFTGLDGL